MRTPELCSVSHTPRRPNHSTARSRDWTPRKMSPNGSEASTAKRSCPAWRRSSSPMAFSMARKAARGSERLTDRWSVNRCRAKRLKFIVSPTAGGAASAESAAASAEPAATAKAPTAETSAGPAAARPPAAAVAQSVDERDDKSDQPPDDREREHARRYPDDGADDPSGNSGSDDTAEEAPEDRIGQNQRDEQQDYRLEIDRMMNAVDGHSGPRRRQAFSLDELHERVGSGRNATVEIVRLEVRRDDFGYH